MEDASGAYRHSGRGNGVSQPQFCHLFSPHVTNRHKSVRVMMLLRYVDALDLLYVFG